MILAPVPSLVLIVVLIARVARRRAVTLAWVVLVVARLARHHRGQTRCSHGAGRKIAQQSLCRRRHRSAPVRRGNIGIGVKSTTPDIDS